MNLFRYGCSKNNTILKVAVVAYSIILTLCVLTLRIIA